MMKMLRGNHFPFANGYSFGDPDAKSYIAAVEAADGQALESGVVTAINDFVVGCKADGIWNAIKASCILAGARTLGGALVPLTGAAPTNFNFVSGDYNRKTGLKGDGSTKYLDSNRNNNADPRDSQHLCVFASEALSDISRYMGSGSNAGSSTVGLSGSNFGFRSRNASNFDTGALMANGFLGKSRADGATVTSRISLTTRTHNQTSNAPASETIEVFRGAVAPTASRFSFYSIGESLDLALLDTRVTRLMAEMQFAINTGLNASSYDIDTLNYVNRGYAAGGSLA